MIRELLILRPHHLLLACVVGGLLFPAFAGTFITGIVFVAGLIIGEWLVASTMAKWLKVYRAEVRRLRGVNRRMAKSARERAGRMG